MGDLDNLSKYVLECRPADILNWLAPDVVVESAHSIATEINSPPRLADKVLAFDLAGPVKKLVLHIEVQARWNAELPSRMFRYFTGLKDQHENLESLLLILRPGGGNPQNTYEVVSPLGQRTRHNFWLRCLWEHPVEELLQSGLPGLLPFVPFAKGASPERLEDALDVLKSAPEEVQGELQSSLIVLGKQVFESWDWRRFLKKEGLMGLRLIEELLADEKEALLRQGEKKGEKRGKKKGEKKGKKEGETAERLRLLTEQLRTCLGKEGAVFSEALATLKPEVHNQIATLLVTVRGKKKLVQKLQELIQSS